MSKTATRRRFLKVSAIGALTSLAGCSSSQSSSEPTTQAATATTQRVVDTTERMDTTEQVETTEQGDESGGESDAQQVGKNIRPAVVSVDTQTSSTTGGSGTGWFVDDNHVITNSHVIADAESITCWTLEGESFEPEVVGSTDHRSPPYHDIALLETDFDAPETLSLGDESTLSEGQTVVQVGHPYAIGNWVISSGEFVRQREYNDAILTTTPNMSGNSGSPLVTLEQNVVGLTTGGVPKSQSTRGPDEAPEPVEPEVYESYQDATYATHNPASAVEQNVDEWTSE